MKKLSALLVVLAGLIPVNAYAAEIAVIVNKANPIDSLTPKEVQQIFLAKKMSFPDGQQVVPVVYKYEHALHKKYLRKIVKKTRSQYQVYWTRMVFTGKSQPPKSYSSQDTMLKMVASNPSYMGFVERDRVDDSVKVVLTLEE